MELFNEITVPRAFILETRNESKCNMFLEQPAANGQAVNGTSDARVSDFVRKILAADVTKHPLIKDIRLISDGNKIRFDLREPIIPRMVIYQNKKYILDEETRHKLKAADSGLEIHAFIMQIPRSYNDMLYVMAARKDGHYSSHPNSNNDRMCYGTYQNRMHLGQVQISKLVDLMNIANLGSAYRSFSYTPDWAKIPHEDY